MSLLLFSERSLEIPREHCVQRTALFCANPGAAPTVPIGHTDEVTSASFSPDGTRVVTASADGTAIISGFSG
jgi:WD40 repeat protein